jgi:hypothetical protein
MSNELNRHINILNIEVRLKLVAAAPLSFVFNFTYFDFCGVDLE